MTHQGTVPLKTPLLLLRRYVMEDAAGMFRNYATDPEVCRFLSWLPYTRAEDVAAFLETQITAYERDDFYHWAMELEGEVVGGISAVAVDDRNHSCELGYCLGRAHWNRGYTSEAMLAVMRYLFEEVGVHRLMAKHDVDNPASGKVMEKCGMRPEGRLREHYRRHDGSYGDSLVYGVLAKEWAGGPEAT